MLIENARVNFPALIDLIGSADAGQNVESKILTLRSAHVRIAVDPAETESAGKIGNDSPVGTHKIVTSAEIDAEVMIFHAAKDRLRHQGQAELIVAARPVVAVIHAPTNSALD